MNSTRFPLRQTNDENNKHFNQPALPSVQPLCVKLLFQGQLMKEYCHLDPVLKCQSCQTYYLHSISQREKDQCPLLVWNEQD